MYCHEVDSIYHATHVVRWPTLCLVYQFVVKSLQRLLADRPRIDVFRDARELFTRKNNNDIL